MGAGPPTGAAGLSLREFAPGDRQALVEMHRDPRIRAWLVDDVPLDHPVVAHEFIQRMQRYYREHEGLGIWCAERWRAPLSAAERADPEVAAALSDAALARLAVPVPRFAGWFNLMRVPRMEDRIELGCRLLPREWGTRLVYQGCGALLDHAFQQLRLPRVLGVCHPAHRSAQHALLTLGFAAEGERCYVDRPARWFAIDADRWAAAKARPLRLRMRALESPAEPDLLGRREPA
jgi:RimJ/RimL family protein N-acetyltransferase